MQDTVSYTVHSFLLPQQSEQECSQNLQLWNAKQLEQHFWICFLICDIIKGNESNVGNIGFEWQAKRGDIFLFYIVFWFKELIISLQLDIQLRWDLN